MYFFRHNVDRIRFCMKLEEDKTPGTRPERPWLSWSAIDAIYFPFPALISLVLTSFRQVGPTTQPLCLWRSADYESPLPCAASDRWYTEKAWKKAVVRGNFGEKGADLSEQQNWRVRYWEVLNEKYRYVLINQREPFVFQLNKLRF